MVYCAFYYDDLSGIPILTVDILSVDIQKRRVAFEIYEGKGKDESPGIAIVEDGDTVFFEREELLEKGLTDTASLLEWVGVKEWVFLPWDVESRKNWNRFDRIIEEFLSKEEEQ